MPGWSEVADGVFQARYDPFDVTVAVVRGADGLLVVDTRGSHRQGLALRSDLRRLGGRVRGVVNTHAHFDHTFGNDCFGPGSPASVPIYAHQRLPEHLLEHESRFLADAEDGAGTVLTLPTDLVGDRHHLDLGDRGVLMLHLGRGHTDHDLVLHVADAGAWLVGDLVEESGPPMCGADGFPLAWPGTLAALLALVGPHDVLVPGHGRAVGREFVVTQQSALAAVADLIRALHGAGVSARDALEAGGSRWPFPAAVLADAVRCGFAHLDG